MTFQLLALAMALWTPPLAASPDVTPQIKTTPPANGPESALNPRYVPPAEEPRWGPKMLIGSGVGLVVAGLIGMVLAEGCRTRDAQDRCVDPYGGSNIAPSMVVLGLGFTITGGYWYRRSAYSSSEAQE